MQGQRKNEFLSIGIHFGQHYRYFKVHAEIIYLRFLDAIESNAFKHAESLCEKALKKWPGNTQVTALKALILWYNSKMEASNIQVKEVLARNPTDFLTLSVMERILESRNDYSTLVTLFENSLKASFDDRVAERIYFFYLKIGQTKKLYTVRRDTLFENICLNAIRLRASYMREQKMTFSPTGLFLG